MTNFNYIKPTEEQIAKMQYFRDKFQSLYDEINNIEDENLDTIIEIAKDFYEEVDYSIFIDTGGVLKLYMMLTHKDEQ